MHTHFRVPQKTANIAKAGRAHLVVRAVQSVQSVVQSVATQEVENVWRCQNETKIH